MAPVFSLVWDEDVSALTALTFPELYKDLMKVYMHMMHAFTPTHTSIHTWIAQTRTAPYTIVHLLQCYLL